MTFFGVLVALISGGIYLMLFTMELDDLGQLFYKLINYLSLIGWTLVFLMIRTKTFMDWIQFGTVFSLISLEFFHLYFLVAKRDTARRLSYWGGFGLTLIIYGTCVWGEPVGSIVQEVDALNPWIYWAQLVFSAAILGSIIDAMICGHWYLVNADLPLRPIRSISRALTLSILVKLSLIIWVLLAVNLHSRILYEITVFAFPLLFWVRILIGAGGGLLFNWMSWRALLYENTQASTGILYACITWIIMGEFTAFYLTIQTKVPL